MSSWQAGCTVVMSSMNLLQLTEADQELYKNFPLVVSERWQQEVAETVFDAINQDTDKIEQKKKNKPKIDEMEESMLDNYFIYCLLVIKKNSSMKGKK